MIHKRHQDTIPQILCDANLEDTAHWLRAAGYDVYVSFVNLSDHQLLTMAVQNNRVLLIRRNDIEIISENDSDVIALDSNYLYDQIKQIGQHLAIDWLYKPLSRCMICNTQLHKLNINMWLDLPDEVKNKTETSHACPACKRIYWAGEQVDKMVDQLQSFKDSQH